MKTLLALLALLGSVRAQTFLDVPVGHWAGNAVEELVRSGILVGFPNGTFQGENAVSRYEVALIVSRLLDVVDRRVAPGLQETEQLLARLEALSTEWRSSADDRQALTAVVGAALADLERVSDSVGELQRNAPTTLALFDSLRQNLVELEQGFGTSLLATKEDTLTELDLRLTDFRAELEESFTQRVEQRLETYDATVNARLESLGADLSSVEAAVQANAADLGKVKKEATEREAALRDEIGGLNRRLEASATTTGASVVVSGGFAGDGPRYGVAITGYRGPALVEGVLNEEGFELLGRYRLAKLSVTGRYLSKARGSLGGVQVGTGALAPLLLEADVAYGAGLEFGARVHHDGTAPNAVVRGLDLSAAARFALGDAPRTLIDIQTSLALPVAGFTVTPGFLYRNVSGAYQGFVGSLALRYDLGEVNLMAEGRYGRFSPLGDGTTRGVPEFSASVSYQEFRLTGFLDAGLPDRETYPTFFDTDPLPRQGLHLGARVSVRVSFP